MDKSRLRYTLGTLLCGVAIGSLATLLCLNARGVSLVPGTNNAAFQKFYTAYADLHSEYYESVPSSQLLNGAVDGMTKSLGDKFTDYFPPAAASSFTNMLDSQFVGIGVTVQAESNGFLIVSVLPNTPASKAGLKAHDEIVEVNGTSIVGMEENKALALITGKAGSKVVVVVKRPATGNTMSFQMTRAKITQPSVQTRMLQSHVGYLQISIIGENTAAEVAKALRKLNREGATRLIVDLRDNGGGYLDQALQIAGDFIPKGKVVLYTVGRGGAPIPMDSPGPGLKKPLVVLMNQNTASAAEVLSAALHEDMGAPLIGVKSYGKGTVQQIEQFTDGSALKYTVDKWLTPHQEWIHRKGIQPTIRSQLPSYVNLQSLSSAHFPLQYNQNSSAVALIQKYLSALRYPVDRTDGYFDASTETAVKSYQAHDHLPQTGIVDSRTAANLEADLESLILTSDSQLQKAETVVTHLSAGS